jgi:glycosyltransferase involved in cell wall biosynthesis
VALVSVAVASLASDSPLREPVEPSAEPTAGPMPEPTIVAVVPCFNEEAAVGKVVTDLLAAVPGITVYVYDNNSTDRTAEVARAAGAVVRTETRRGKGNVVRRAFADLEADVYLLIDGDDTYDVQAAPLMIQTLLAGPYDHVLGVRTLPVETASSTAYRPGHAAGNLMFNRLVGGLFGEPVTDMLSGYRVFSHRFVKSFPALSREFEIETELTVHAVNLRIPQVSVPVGFRDRAEGSTSKLRTYHDGMKILRLIAELLQYERPMLLFGALGLLVAVVSLALGVPIFVEFAHTHRVPRFPTAFAAASLMIIAILCVVVGLILNGVLRMRQEMSRLQYLRWPAPPYRPVPVGPVGSVE